MLFQLLGSEVLSGIVLMVVTGTAFAQTLGLGFECLGFCTIIEGVLPSGFRSLKM